MEENSQSIPHEKIYKPTEIIGIFEQILSSQNAHAPIVYIRGIYKQKQHRPQWRILLLKREYNYAPMLFIFIVTMKVESCLSAFSISLCLAPQRWMKAFLLPVPWLLLQHLLPLHSSPLAHASLVRSVQAI